MPFDLNNLFGPFQGIFESFFGWLSQILESLFGAFGGAM